MFFNVFEDSYDVLLEIYLGNAAVQRQKMSMPSAILQAQFLQICQQLAQDNRPMGCKMERYEEVWDNFEGKTKPVAYAIEFKNRKLSDG